MPKNNMPPNWEPPAPAWESYWEDRSEDLIAAYFGIQADDPAHLQSWTDTAFAGKHAPESVDHGAYTDVRGVRNHIYIAYWRHSAYQQWWQLNSAWWQSAERESEGVGYWREVVCMPFDRFETLHSTENNHGVAELADGFEGPIKEHGYPGGARDRIALSARSSLKNMDSVRSPLAAETTGKMRVRVIPPEYMCVIRSGQNWSACDSEEKQHYLNQLHPVLIVGMNFLRDNPEETSCYSMRFVDTKTKDWNNMEQSFGLGYATDIHAFEIWAKEHPTHLAIFGGFMRMVEMFGENMRLQLWHEVTVLPPEGCEFEYIGCHGQTGLLPYV